MPLINTRGAASIKGFGFAGFSPTVPGMPTSVSASATSSSSISVSFTAPACNGGLSIDYYQAVCTATGTHSATGSSPISVTGLCSSTSYTFKVRAHNSLGYGSYSSSTGTTTTSAVVGSQSYTSCGSYSWVVPSGVTKVSMFTINGGNSGCPGYIVCCCGRMYSISGNAGWGGGLAYTNNHSVTPGTTLYAHVNYAAATWVATTSCYCLRNEIVASNQYHGCTGCGKFNGGGGGYSSISSQGSGGGGAAGYSGGGGGGALTCGHPINGISGTGGGGGGGSRGSSYHGGPGGGGIGIYGQGSNGSGGSGTNSPGGGGSGGSSGSASSTAVGAAGGAYGGGGGSGGGSGYNAGGNGAGGAIRIIWPGCSRQFPSTCTGSP